MERDRDESARVGHLREQVGEIVTAASFLGVWAFVWYLVSDFPDAAQTFPRFVLLCLFAFSAIHLARACWLVVRTPTRGPDHKPAAATPETKVVAPRSTARLLFLIAGSVAYVLLLPRIGFVVTTVTFLLLGVCLSIGWTVRTVIAIVSLVLALYVIVDVLLDVGLPSGILI